MPATIDKNAINKRFPVPEGFRALLEALAREVLRGQPSDIYEFSALFFDKLLQMRREFDINPVQDTEYYDKFKVQLFTEASKRQLVSPKLAISMGIALDEAKFVESVPPRRNSEKRNDENRKHSYGDDIVVQSHVTQRRAEYDFAAPPLSESEYIFEKPRNVAQRGDENEDTFNDELEGDAAQRAATKIQAEIRGFLTRKNFERIKDSRKSVQIGSSSENLGRSLKPSHSMDAIGGMDIDDDAMSAATKIQAGIRGYLARQKYNQKKTQQKKAASKIQAGIRGHLTRKHLEAEGVPIHRTSRSPSPMTKGGGSSQNIPVEGVRRVSGDPNSDYAASKIQAGIRGYLTRKQLEQRGVTVHPPRRQSIQPRHFTSASFGIRDRSGTNPDETAATKIQAGIRGYLTRKHLKHNDGGNRLAVSGSEEFTEPAQEQYAHGNRTASFGGTGAVNPDFAATKIQAGVRSYLTRANMKKQKHAATKIQSAFRGHQVRRDVRPSSNTPDRNRSNEEENGWENVPSDGEA